MSRQYSRSYLWLGFVELLAVLAMSGCNQLPGRPAPGPEVVRPGDVHDFMTLYKQNCAGCHGAEGREVRPSRLPIPSTWRSSMTPPFGGLPPTACPAR